MAIDWNIARQPNALAMMMQGYDEGVKLRRENAARNALGVIMGAGKAGTPGSAYDPKRDGIGGGLPQNGGPDPTEQAWGDLAKADPLTALKARELFAGKAAEQRKVQDAQTEQIGRLLQAVKTDPSKYGMARQSAISLGIPADRIPEAYDPQWVDQQLFTLNAFKEDGGAAMTSAMKELVALGYKPGTPEFQQALAQTMNAGYSKPYTDSSGATRLYTPNIAVPAQAPAPKTPQGPAQQPITFEMFRGATNGLGAQGAAAWLQRNGLPVRVSTPQEAEQLPRGTRIVLPDGSEGVVP